MLDCRIIKVKKNNSGGIYKKKKKFIEAKCVSLQVKEKKKFL